MFNSCLPASHGRGRVADALIYAAYLSFLQHLQLLTVPRENDVVAPASLQGPAVLIRVAFVAGLGEHMKPLARAMLREYIKGVQVCEQMLLYWHFPCNGTYMCKCMNVVLTGIHGIEGCTCLLDYRFV